MTWLETLMLATGESESPSKYYYWSGLAAISAVLKSNVYLDRFIYKLYPNIFVLLTGQSGIKKGPAVNLAKSLVTSVDQTRIFSGRMSIQKMIEELGKVQSREGKEMIKDASGFLVASEFASFIIQDPSALTILTDLYDTIYHPEWKYYTKSGGTVVLKYPCLTLLGASNEVHFKQAIPSDAVSGGFIARTFIIHSTKPGKRNPLTKRPEHWDSTRDLPTYLKELSNVKGEFKWTDSGKTLYDNWYEQFGDVEKNDDTGTLNRIPDSILKVAMLISASRDLNLVILEEDIEEAIEVCEQTVSGIRRVTAGTGTNKLGPQTALVIRILLAAPEYRATREHILEKSWGHFDGYEFERIVETLGQMRAISILSGKAEPEYILADKIIKNFEEKVKKKK